MFLRFRPQACGRQGGEAARACAIEGVGTLRPDTASQRWAARDHAGTKSSSARGRLRLRGACWLAADACCRPSSGGLKKRRRQELQSDRFRTSNLQVCPSSGVHDESRARRVRFVHCRATPAQAKSGIRKRHGFGWASGAALLMAGPGSGKANGLKATLRTDPQKRPFSEYTNRGLTMTSRT